MLKEKLEELKLAEIEFDKIHNSQEIKDLNLIINKAKDKIDEIQRSFLQKVDFYNNFVRQLIINRLKMLKTNGYYSRITGSPASFSYYIASDTIHLQEESTVWGETFYDEQEIPLELFTCEDSEVSDVIKKIRNQGQIKKDALKKEKELLQLEELQEKYKDYVK